MVLPEIRYSFSTGVGLAECIRFGSCVTDIWSTGRQAVMPHFLLQPTSERRFSRLHRSSMRVELQWACAPSFFNVDRRHVDVLGSRTDTSASGRNPTLVRYRRGKIRDGNDGVHPLWLSRLGCAWRHPQTAALSLLQPARFGP